MHLMNVLHGKTKKYNKLRNAFNIMYNSYYDLNENETD